MQAANAITDTTGQADKLTGLAGQDYSCFIVNPISGTNLVQGLAQLGRQEARRSSTSTAPSTPAAAKAANAAPATYIGTDNVSAGEKAGAHMVTLLPDGGKVAVDRRHRRRRHQRRPDRGIHRGHRRQARPRADGRRRTGSAQEALTQATNMMRAQPDLAGFFVANDDMGLGVARAVANAGKTGKVKIISVDGVKDALAAVKAGELDAVVAQYPYAIGLMGVRGLPGRGRRARPCPRTSRPRSRWSPRRTPTRRSPPRRSRSAAYDRPLHQPSIK